MKRSRRAPVLGLIGLSTVGLIAGAFAYWHQNATVDNPFDTGKYGSTVVEEFKPSDGENWQPGSQVNKSVKAKNTGNQDLIVRARLDETWTRKDDPLTPINEAVKYKDSKTDPYDVYTTNQADAADGLTAADTSVVTKNFSASPNWIAGPDGWYYYKANLPGGQSTDAWLESVKLLQDADMGKMSTKYYVSASTGPESGWVWFEYTGSMPRYIDAAGQPCNKDDVGAQEVLRNKSETKYESDAVKGYSDSDYVLKVTVQTVQPTQAALDAVFGNGTPFPAPGGTSWTLR